MSIVRLTTWSDNQILTATALNAEFDNIVNATPAGTIVGTSDSQTLSNKTLTTPTIASFVNATHTHQAAASGGTLAEAALALTDVTTANVTTSAHGFTPKAPNDTTKFLRGDATWAVPSSSGVYCLVRQDSVQTIPHNTETSITWDTEQFDTSTMHAPGDNTKITVPNTGVYMISYKIPWVHNATATRFAYIRVNGSSGLAGSATTVNHDGTSANDGAIPNELTIIWTANAGDYFEIRVSQGSGGPLNIYSAGGSSTYNPIFWVLQIS